MKALLVMMLCVSPAFADVAVGPSSRQSRIQYDVNTTTGDIQMVQRPVSIRVLAVWRFDDPAGAWQPLVVQSQTLLLAPQMNLTVSLKNFLANPSLTPGLYYAIADVDGARERSLIYAAKKKCVDVMIGPAHDKLIPTCVPLADGRGAHARFVPDPDLLQP
jgi:hypothetical protein